MPVKVGLLIAKASGVANCMDTFVGRTEEQDVKKSKEEKEE